MGMDFGYGNLQVLVHYLKSVAVINGIGIVGGIVLGNWLGRELAAIFTEFYHFPYLSYGVFWRVVGDVDEGSQNRFTIGRHGTEERTQLAVSNFGLGRFPGGEQVTQKPFQIIIGFVEGEPGDG